MGKTIGVEPEGEPTVDDLTVVQVAGQTDGVQIEGEEFVISNRGAARCGFCTQHTEVHYSLCWGLCSGVVPQEITDRWVPYLECCTAAAVKKVAALKANHGSS